MGKFDGKHIRGLVGNVVVRKGRNGDEIVQAAPRKYKQTKATKKAASVFGQGSTLAATVRQHLYPLFAENYDSSMIDRFNVPVKAVLREAYNKETDQFSFSGDSFSRLAGFEFNIKSLLIDNLWVQPEMSLNGSQIKITIPELLVNEQLKFPGKANVCEINVAISLIVLNKSLYKNVTHQTITINKDDGVLPLQEFVFDVPDGCLCVVGIGLNYFSLNQNVKTVLNNKTLNPAGLCGAIITPGIFVLPASGNTKYRGMPSDWQEIAKLKMKVKD